MLLQYSESLPRSVFGCIGGDYDDSVFHRIGISELYQHLPVEAPPPWITFAVSFFRVIFVEALLC